MSKRRHRIRQIEQNVAADDRVEQVWIFEPVYLGKFGTDAV
jgi:hypothetical protein